MKNYYWPISWFIEEDICHRIKHEMACNSKLGAQLYHYHYNNALLFLDRW